jgi:D-glycero-D-manno-heptose 1,7-bisphosphate phosphatase
LKKVIFLDRDGILFEEHGNYTYLDEQIRYVPHIEEALRTLRDRGYEFILITNQGGVGKGLYTIERVEEIHAGMQAHFARHGIEFLEMYFCPHHPVTSNCLCRKPDSQMLEKAIARFGIDAGESWFIGDNERDQEAGEKAGVRTLLVPSNADLREYIGEI